MSNQFFDHILIVRFSVWNTIYGLGFVHIRKKIYWSRDFSCFLISTVISAVLYICVSCASQSPTVLKISGSRTHRETAWVHSIPHLARPWIVTDILYISHISTAGLNLPTAKQPVRHALANFRHCTHYAIHLVQLHVSWTRRRSTPGLCGLCGGI
jgi:hypothetical protein